MDDKRLDEIFGTVDVPRPDDNARKVALNMALSAFDAAQKESAKTSQGFPLLARLISKPGHNRRKPMKNTKLVYGGMATAMVLVLAAGVSFQQTRNAFETGAAVDTLTSSMSAGSLAKSSDIKQIAAQPAMAPKVAVNRVATDSAAAPMPAAPPRQFMAMRSEEAAQPLAMADNMAGNMAGKDVTAGAPMMAAGSAGMGVNMAVPAGAMARVDDEIAPPFYQDTGRDQFKNAADNPVKSVAQDPLSTFSIDVDTSSYSFVRRQLNAGVLPPKDAVRVEEMVNYFDYHYPVPESKDQPFQPTVVVTPSPWIAGHKLVHIGIKGYDIPAAQKPHSNLVFLIDTSGSMQSPDKLPLLISSLKLLLQSLKPDDTVGIVTYAGNAGVALEPTKVSESAKIVGVLDSLSAGGGTAGADGIRTAYRLAETHLDKKGVNRVILATDGDFNIGITEPDALKTFIEAERKSGVFLSVLGFGDGNYNDRTMQELAQNGNGTAAYIDTLSEAQKVLVQESSSTLFPIAKDVKIQVEFNPATVAEYRLVGYETRALQNQDFNNDKVDAGDIGAGHAVTAIYDITPVGVAKTVDDSRYAKPQPHKAETAFGNEYAFLKIRYKLPDGDTSKLITTPVTQADESGKSALMLQDANWSTAVAGFAQLLKGGQMTGTLTWDDVINAAQGAKGDDPFGHRSEFIQLARMAKSLGVVPAPQLQPVPQPVPLPVPPPVMEPVRPVE